MFTDKYVVWPWHITPTNSSPVEISNPNNVSHGSAIICICFFALHELWLSQCRSYQHTSPHHAALMISMLCHILVSVVMFRPVKVTSCSFFLYCMCGASQANIIQVTKSLYRLFLEAIHSMVVSSACSSLSLFLQFILKCLVSTFHYNPWLSG